MIVYYNLIETWIKLIVLNSCPFTWFWVSFNTINLIYIEAPHVKLEVMLGTIVHPLKIEKYVVDAHHTDAPHR